MQQWHPISRGPAPWKENENSGNSSILVSDMFPLPDCNLEYLNLLETMNFFRCLHVEREPRRIVPLRATVFRNDVNGYES